MSGFTTEVDGVVKKLKNDLIGKKVNVAYPTARTSVIVLTNEPKFVVLTTYLMWKESKIILNETELTKTLAKNHFSDITEFKDALNNNQQITFVSSTIPDNTMFGSFNVQHWYEETSILLPRSCFLLGKHRGVNNTLCFPFKCHDLWAQHSGSGFNLIIELEYLGVCFTQQAVDCRNALFVLGRSALWQQVRFLKLPMLNRSYKL